jgi:hypothetical protein
MINPHRIKYIGWTDWQLPYNKIVTTMKALGYHSCIVDGDAKAIIFFSDQGAAGNG